MRNSNEFNVKKTFSKRLKLLREEKKLSQDALAEMIGISRGSISFYEKAERTPDIEIFNKIADFFDVTLNYLMGKAEAGKPENEEIGEQTGLSDKAINLLIAEKRGVLPKFINALLEHPNSKRLALRFSKLENDVKEMDEIFKNPVFSPTSDEEEIAESIAKNNKKIKEQTLSIMKHLDRRAEIIYGEKILNYERYEVERIFREILLEMAGTTEEKIQEAKGKAYSKNIDEISFRIKSVKSTEDEWLDFLEDNS